MKRDGWFDEEQVVRHIMRRLKLSEREACAWLEHAVHTSQLTPEGLTEAERPHWKCWKNLN